MIDINANDEQSRLVDVIEQIVNSENKKVIIYTNNTSHSGELLDFNSLLVVLDKNTNNCFIRIDTISAIERQ